MVWLIDFGITVGKILRIEISKKPAESSKKTRTPSKQSSKKSLTVAQNPISHTIF